MKHVAIAWLIALLMYWFTPYVMAEESMLWQGRGVVGEVCMQVDATDYQDAEEVLVWVVNDGQTSEWMTVGEWACLPVAFSRQSEIHARYDSRRQEITITEDNTTPYVTIELPF